MSNVLEVCSLSLEVRSWSVKVWGLKCLRCFSCEYQATLCSIGKTVVNGCFEHRGSKTALASTKKVVHSLFTNVVKNDTAMKASSCNKKNFLRSPITPKRRPLRSYVWNAISNIERARFQMPNWKSAWVPSQAIPADLLPIKLFSKRCP